MALIELFDVSSGYIDTWGRGTIKMIDTRKQAELREPEMTELDEGFSITLFKDNISFEKLNKLSLNDRQLKAALIVKEKAKITDSE